MNSILLGQMSDLDTEKSFRSSAKKRGRGTKKSKSKYESNTKDVGKRRLSRSRKSEAAVSPPKPNYEPKFDYSSKKDEYKKIPDLTDSEMRRKFYDRLSKSVAPKETKEVSKPAHFEAISDSQYSRLCMKSPKKSRNSLKPSN